MADVPTPIRHYRRYSRKTKAMAVIAAATTSVQAAAEQAGIPERTVGYWFDHPDFAEIRAKTREDLAAETMGLAHVVAGEIKRRMGEFEPRDLSVLMGILVDKGQLLAGHATSRMETRDLTDNLDDGERETLRNAIDDYLQKAKDDIIDEAIGQIPYEGDL